LRWQFGFKPLRSAAQENACRASLFFLLLTNESPIAATKCFTPTTFLVFEICCHKPAQKSVQQQLRSTTQPKLTGSFRASG